MRYTCVFFTLLLIFISFVPQEDAEIKVEKETASSNEEMQSTQPPLKIDSVTETLKPRRGVKIRKIQRTPDSRPTEFDGTMVASWYGPGFHGRLTASGEKYNMNAISAAHPWLPFGTELLVLNPRNWRSSVVRVNDRGPFIIGRTLDLSYGAAKRLGIVEKGVVRLRYKILKLPRS